MSSTKSILGSAVSRISSHLTKVYPEFIAGSAIAGTVCCFPVSPVCSAALALPATTHSEGRCRCLESLDAVQLSTRKVSPFEILIEVEKFTGSGDNGTDQVFDWTQLKGFLPHAAQQAEWEDYEEPIWNPVKSEIRLLVKKFFEQADADPQRAQ